MKTKLLKKVRKRFAWTWSEDYDRYEVVDVYKEKFYFIDDKYVRKYFGKDEEPPCGYKQAKRRILKDVIYSPFISNPLDKLIYRKVKRGIIKSPNAKTKKG